MSLSADAIERKPLQRPPLRTWDLSVVGSFDVEPRMRRVLLTARDLNDFAYKPGQALVLMIPVSGSGTGLRDYTIRGFDRAAGTLSIDFVLHGDTPGPNWARTVRPGDRIEARGPRGGTVLRDGADWHLFTGDETGLPAIAHILETMPAGARALVYIEVADRSGEILLPALADARVTWVHRNGAPAGPSERMDVIVRDLDLPPGRGHAYIVGETSNVRRQRRTLLARGLARDQISSEGYWRPGRIGGHDHVDD
jgi:NADPH-dependent ferric siderophore reductase